MADIPHEQRRAARSAVGRLCAYGATFACRFGRAWHSICCRLTPARYCHLPDHLPAYPTFDLAVISRYGCMTPFFPPPSPLLLFQRLPQWVDLRRPLLPPTRSGCRGNVLPPVTCMDTRRVDRSYAYICYHMTMVWITFTRLLSSLPITV